jgi:hypothetical protein
LGMGDKKKPFEPSYEPVRDDTNGKMFSPGCVRHCPHPGVIAKYGTGGIANVSVYTCRKCRYVIKHQWIGGVSCGYTETQ